MKTPMPSIVFFLELNGKKYMYTPQLRFFENSEGEKVLQQGFLEQHPLDPTQHRLIWLNVSTVKDISKNVIKQ